MPFISPRNIAPAQVSSPTDGDVLDELETLSLDSENIASGSVGHAHLLCSRGVNAASTLLPVTTWVGTLSVGTGSQTVSNDIYPGDTVSLGDDLNLVCPDNTTVLLRTGDVLRWHGMVRVTEVDDSGDPAVDLYHVVVRVKGHGIDGIGYWRTGANNQKLGIVHTYSMNAARLDASSDGAGSDKELWDQWVSFSNVYIHDEDDSPWPGTTVTIDEIEVCVYVETAINSVTIEAGKLTAMIVKG